MAETCPGGIDAWCWEQSTGLLPESEWQPYVGRSSAFGQGRVDPARSPVLSRARSATKAPSSPKKAVAAKPKTDPCEERIWKAFDEAAKAGKIPQEAVPPNPNSKPAAPVATAPQASAPAIPPASAASVEPAMPAPSPSSASTGNAVHPTGGGGVYTPYSSSVAVPGTSAQGMSVPRPSLVTNANNHPFATN